MKDAKFCILNCALSIIQFGYIVQTMRATARVRERESNGKTCIARYMLPSDKIQYSRETPIPMLIPPLSNSLSLFPRALTYPLRLHRLTSKSTLGEYGN